MATLDLSKPGATIALPVLTGTDGGAETITSIIISNNQNDEFTLAINVISGDPEDRWASNSFFCLVSPREVTHFLFVPESSGSRVFFECSLPDAHPFDEESVNQQKDLPLIAATGIMFVALEQNSADAQKAIALLQRARDAAQKVKAADFAEQGLKGPTLGGAIQAAQIERIAELLE